MTKIFLLSSFIFAGLFFSGDDKKQIVLSGIVSENEVIPLEGVSVVVYESFEKVSETTTLAKGVFSLNLEPGKDYIIEFSKPLYVTKKISVSTETPDNCKKVPGKIQIDVVSLFKIVEGVDYKLLKKPIVYYQFSENCKFIIDENHARTIAPFLEKLKEDITARQIELSKLSAKEEKKKTEETKAIYEQYKAETKKEEEKEKFKTLSSDAKFKELVTQADAKFAKGDYEGAKQKYTEALKYKAGELYPEMQLIRIEEIFAIQREELASKNKMKDEQKKSEETKELAQTVAETTVKNEKELKKTEALLQQIADESSAKKNTAQLEKQKEIDRTRDMQSILAHAAAKRILLEEIADSKIKLKQTKQL